MKIKLFILLLIIIWLIVACGKHQKEIYGADINSQKEYFNNCLGKPAEPKYFISLNSQRFDEACSYVGKVYESLNLVCYKYDRPGSDTVKYIFVDKTTYIVYKVIDSPYEIPITQQECK